MNLLEIYKKYKNGVQESMVNRIQNSHIEDLDDVADKMLDANAQFIEDFKEYLQEDGVEFDEGYKEDVPGIVSIEENNKEWCIVSVILRTGYDDGMYTYSHIEYPKDKWEIVVEFADEEWSEGMEVDWDKLEDYQKNSIINYLNFTDFRYGLNESLVGRVKKNNGQDMIGIADKMLNQVIVKTINSPKTLSYECNSDVFTQKDAEKFYKENIEDIHNNVRSVEVIGIKELGDYALYPFREATELILREGVKVLGKESCCSMRITSINLPSSLEVIDRGAFRNCNFEKVFVPSTVNYIGACAFSMSSLKELVIDNHNIHIDRNFVKPETEVVFKNYKPSVEETFDTNTPIEFEDKEVENVFFDNYVDRDSCDDGIYTIKDAIDAGKDSEEFWRDFPLQENTDSYWKDNTDIMKFNELKYFQEIRMIPEYCFANCSSLTEISLPYKVMNIEESAFVNCVSLKTVNLPKSGLLKLISESAFANTGLETVVIPEGVVEIEDYAFSDCDKLKSVVLPSTLKKIGKCVFSDCKNLESVQGLENVSEFGTDVFWGCSKLISNLDDKFKPTVYEDGGKFDLSWADDWDKIQEEAVVSYILNNYDTDDVDDLVDNEEWQEDEMNPDSENFNEREFEEFAYDHVNWICQDDWDNFKSSIGDNDSWVSPDDEETWGSIEDAIDYCIGERCDWSDITVVAEDGGLTVNGTYIYPQTDRSMLGDDVESYIPNEYIDWNSRRFSDRKVVKIWG